MRQILPIALFLVLPTTSVLAAEPDAAGIEFFETKIRPVLVENCYECHSSQSDTIQGGLLLDSRDAMLRGGDSGAAMVPKDLTASLVLTSIKYESFEMPPSGPLPKSVISDFEKWIEMGGPDPRNEPSNPNADSVKKEIDFDQARKFWSFQPPQRHEPPVVENADRVTGPVDSFILSRLETAGLTLNEEADRRTLIRRLNFVVLGLPPTIEEVEAFVADESPNAWEKQIDRVLSSPHYGERIARMWLDLMRYAEDQAHIVGNDTSLCYPNAYLYRDWVINALNADMPYDEFVKRQLAADKMEPDNADAHIALGFLGLGPKYYRRGAPEVMAEEWENHVDTVTRGLLGLTVACARCHDHKYDPIPTTDYYALAGVFASTELYNRPFPEAQKSFDEAKAKLAEEEKAAALVQEKLAELEKAIAAINSDSATAKEANPKLEEAAKVLKASLDKDKKARDKKKPKLTPEDSQHLVRDKNPRDIKVQIRGDYKNEGELSERAFLTVLSANGSQRFDEGSGRLQLAESIVNRDNPLAARVVVNRVWSMMFGKPLVGTPSNFGTLGDEPSHPKLLDDLSVRFMENGWSLKWLCREILVSSTWRQSSQIVAAKAAIDPANKLLWRADRRRLNIEAWRDALLTVSGRLDETIGGTSIDPQSPDTTRRTIYARVSRLELNKMLALFDFPDPNVHAAHRSETTTPLQKMFLLNSPFMVAQANALADTAIKAADSNAERVAWTYRRVFGREVTDEELQPALAFLTESNTEQIDRWQQYAQVLLASNEMLVID